MGGFEIILCPVDFDDPSMEALKLAASLAKSSGATLHLLHVIPILPSLGEPVLETFAPKNGEQEEVRRRLEEKAQRYLQAVPHQVRTCTAFPPNVADAILRVAQEIEAGLIVMATHGRTGLSYFFLGSVAERVLREAPCPVMTVRSRFAVREKPLAESVLPPV
jgi:universal stress protein A